MAKKTIAADMLQKRATAEVWATTPYILDSGQFGVDITNNIVKFGDGVKTWAQLEPFNSGDGTLPNFVAGEGIDIDIEGNTVTITNVSTGSDIVDNLESEDTDKALSANQGKLLNEKIEEIVNNLISSGSENYVAGRFSDTELVTDTNAILIPDPDFITGNESFIDGYKFTADKPGLYFISVGNFRISNAANFKRGTIELRNTENNAIATYSEEDFSNVQDARLSNTVIAWLEIGQYFNYTVAASADQDSILAGDNAQKYLGRYTFGLLNTSISTEGIGEIDIVDSLLSSSPDKALSAKQGKILNEKIDSLVDNDTVIDIVDNLTSTDTDKALSANQGKELNDKIDSLDLTGGTVDIVDNLESEDTDKALSANQGKLLNEKIEAIVDNDTVIDVVDNLTTTDSDKALSANQGKVLNDKINLLELTGGGSDSIKYAAGDGISINKVSQSLEFKSFDGWENVNLSDITVINTDDSEDISDGEYLLHIEYSKYIPELDLLLGVSTPEIFISHDRGTSWEYYSDLQDSYTNDTIFFEDYSIAYSPSLNIITTGNAYSIDGGETWHSSNVYLINGTSKTTSTYFFDIIWNEKRNAFYSAASTSGGYLRIYHSTDGINWYYNALAVTEVYDGDNNVLRSTSSTRSSYYNNDSSIICLDDGTMFISNAEHSSHGLTSLVLKPDKTDSEWIEYKIRFSYYNYEEEEEIDSEESEGWYITNSAENMVETMVYNPELKTFVGLVYVYGEEYNYELFVGTDIWDKNNWTIIPNITQYYNGENEVKDVIKLIYNPDIKLFLIAFRDNNSIHSIDGYNWIADNYPELEDFRLYNVYNTYGNFFGFISYDNSDGGNEGLLKSLVTFEGSSSGDAYIITNTKPQEEIIDNLTSTSATKVLSAKQGKVLEDKKVDKVDIVDNLTSTDSDKVLSAKQGKILNDKILAGGGSVNYTAGYGIKIGREDESVFESFDGWEIINPDDIKMVNVNNSEDILEGPGYLDNINFYKYIKELDLVIGFHSGNIFISNDHGVNWTFNNDVHDSNTDEEVAFNDHALIYNESLGILTTGTVYSTDGGETWHKCNIYNYDMSKSNYFCYGIIWNEKRNSFYSISYSNLHIYRSSDGINWYSIFETVPSSNVLYDGDKNKYYEYDEENMAYYGETGINIICLDDGTMIINPSDSGLLVLKPNEDDNKWIDYKIRFSDYNYEEETESDASEEKEGYYLINEYSVTIISLKYSPELKTFVGIVRLDDDIYELFVGTDIWDKNNWTIITDINQYYDGDGDGEVVSISYNPDLKLFVIAFEYSNIIYSSDGHNWSKLNHPELEDFRLYENIFDISTEGFYVVGTSDSAHALKSLITLGSSPTGDNYVITNTMPLEIVNNLTSNDTNKALSAVQGKVLNDKIEGFTNVSGGDISIEAGNGVTIDTITVKTNTFDWHEENSFISIKGACWSSELGIFVAGGYNLLLTSPDGVDWTSHELDPTYDSYTFNSFVWSPELHLFVTSASVFDQDAGTYGTIYRTVGYSSDGLNWTFSIDNEIDVFELEWISARNIFVGIGTDKIYISEDGIDWDEIELDKNNFEGSEEFDYVYNSQIVYNPDLDEFYLGIVFYYNSAYFPRIFTSNDLEVWYKTSWAENNNLYPLYIAYSPTIQKYVGTNIDGHVGLDGFTNTLTIFDGTDNEIVTIPEVSKIRYINYYPVLDKFIVLGQVNDINYDPKEFFIASSSDGKTWEILRKYHNEITDNYEQTTAYSPELNTLVALNLLTYNLVTLLLNETNFVNYVITSNIANDFDTFAADTALSASQGWFLNNRLSAIEAEFPDVREYVIERLLHGIDSGRIYED